MLDFIEVMEMENFIDSDFMFKKIKRKNTIKYILHNIRQGCNNKIFLTTIHV